MPAERFKIPKLIAPLLVLSIVLNILRVVIFESYSFSYILWNVFLAFIPLIISSILLVNAKKENIIKPYFIVAFVFWILFLPNSPYVVTDFIHLGHARNIPIMFDVFLLFSSALVSLLAGFYSLVQMEKIFLLKFSQKITDYIIGVVILLCSFGIYLGRFLRFNSWDLFTSHSSLISTIWKIFTEQNNYENVFTYTLLFFFFIYMTYHSFKNTNLNG